MGTLKLWSADVQIEEGKWVTRPIVLAPGVEALGNERREPVVDYVARVRMPGQKWRIVLRDKGEIERRLS